MRDSPDIKAAGIIIIRRASSATRDSLDTKAGDTRSTLMRAADDGTGGIPVSSSWFHRHDTAGGARNITVCRSPCRCRPTAS
jgi:hypothetical protein